MCLKLNMNLRNYNQIESYFHSLLVINGHLKTATKKSDINLRDLLIEYGSFQRIFDSHFKLNLVDESNRNTSAKSLEKKIKSINFNFNLLTVNDDDFPSGLRDVSYATPVIYYRGNIDLLNQNSVGVVGTREISKSQDILQGYKCVEDLVNQYVIVSGLALGCDTIAHTSAINSGGNTIAVLGTPLNKSYPSQNKSLQEQIAKNNLLISQYPFFSNPGYKGSSFAHRNITTVSLSSEALFVILTGDKGGTINAIKEAVKQYKIIFALPANYNSNLNWTKKYLPNVFPYSLSGDDIVK